MELAGVGPSSEGAENINLRFRESPLCFCALSRFASLHIVGTLALLAVKNKLLGVSTSSSSSPTMGVMVRVRAL